MILQPHPVSEQPTIIIEGELVDKNGRPIPRCTIQIVEWEGDVLDATVGWSSRFRLYVPRPEHPLVIFFRITVLDDKAVSTHDERDAPWMVVNPSDHRVRVRLIALRSAHEPVSRQWQPGWRIERLE